MGKPPGNAGYWGFLPSGAPGAAIARIARQHEEAGLLGSLAVQLYGPPWIPLAAAATSTERTLLGTNVALGFVRSPFETACAAMDLDHLSQGRLVLGLGTSVRTTSEDVFGSRGYGRPLAHLREAVEVIRLVVAESHTGALRSFHGDYYDFDWSQLHPNTPPQRTRIPIWLPALRGPMVELAAEIGDGLFGHPTWSLPWITEVVPRHIHAGLERAGRRREDLHVCVELFVTPNHDPAESVEDARAVTAFYAGIEQSESYYAAHGFGEEAQRLRAGIKRGDYRSRAHLVPDEMASTFVVTGTPEEVRRKVEHVWNVADSVALAPPAFTLSRDKIKYYTSTISETFYT